ncbi:MAG: SGNH/GDSL hydrolase family protein, partial [Clostridia bacterium]|nr:SGNH/GDSL hydrolase family protein [Clostridia bacterium]
DSTFADGSTCHAGYVPPAWEIISLKAAVCHNGLTPLSFTPVFFDGKPFRVVNPGEMFATDPILLSFRKGDTLCLEMEFRGKEYPVLHELVTTSLLKTPNGWEASYKMPRPSMIGCDRPVKEKIVFWGDSITQSLGTEQDSYSGYVMACAAHFPEEYAVWNIGLGYGRGMDAALGGVWAFKASQGDLVSVCFGVNDIFRVGDFETIADGLTKTVERLHRAGCRVLLQNVPPFSFEGEQKQLWYTLRRFIAETLRYKADFYFDPAPYIGYAGGEEHMSKYGPHPNAEGCKLWGDALAKVFPL